MKAEPKEDEDLYADALEVCRKAGFIACATIQRRLAIGYNQAERLARLIVSRGNAAGLPRTPKLEKPQQEGA